jgi:methylenetetrahydrofolate dehydrogenase (NADP+) / methenyltetrahydrofolate cyclohydrolase
MAGHGTELRSKHLVEQIDEGIRERAERFRVQHNGRKPTLAVLSNNGEHGPSRQYVGIKSRVGSRLGFVVHRSILAHEEALRDHIEGYNEDPNVHGIIVQLPLKNPEATDEIVNLISPAKDVDSLGHKSPFQAATPLAIKMLLDGYGIDYLTQQVAIMGQGRLVGAPLLSLLQHSGASRVEGFDIGSSDLDKIGALNSAGVIVSATGAAGILTPGMFEDISIPRVVVDAGTAEANGAGDVSHELRAQASMNGWMLTPEEGGGVGPLTVRALFENVAIAAEQQTDTVYI